MLFTRFFLFCAASFFFSFHLFANTLSHSVSMDSWFSEFKRNASPSELYQFVHSLPKGGDLHHHLSGSGYGQWWYDIASSAEKNGGYTYYTRVSDNGCTAFGDNAFDFETPQFLFHTIAQPTWQGLTQCQQKEYVALAKLDHNQRLGFINSIQLDKPHEGRDEFFERHWQRLNELTANPVLMAKILLLNMQAYQKEHLYYLETQVNIRNKMYPDGSLYTPEDALAVFTDMLNSAEAKATGVTVRFQYALVRFTPNTDEQLKWIYAFVDQHRDWYVGINLVGREDDPKGHPTRFKKVLRQLRAQYPKINLAFHAGESESPNENIKDTLLLGVDRIGHGINLLSDDDTYLLMRNNRYLIETNLISNLKLEYIERFSEHPFPQYLRTGVPTALSTDDKGMWNSSLTDEYYVAVTQFNLSWTELRQLSENSLAYSFLQPNDKAQHLQKLSDALDIFERNSVMQRGTKTKPRYSPFICQFEPVLCTERNSQ